MSSNSYDLDMTTLNITGGNKSSASYKLGDTVGQTAQGLFSSSGYKVKAGFQYIHTIIRFTFTISDLSIDFGSMTPNTPATATNNLTVTSGGAGGYSVQAIENRTLRNSQGNQIADTACDPATSCTRTDAYVWSSSTAYGLGYNMSGTDIDSSDFVNSTYFRPFANALSGHSPATVMSKNGVTSSSTATATYKLNVSPTQEAGYYTNVIQFIAIPTF